MSAAQRETERQHAEAPAKRKAEADAQLAAAGGDITTGAVGWHIMQIQMLKIADMSFITS